jgi:hypothetical protein
MTACVGDFTLEVFVDVFEVGTVVHGLFDATLKRQLFHELLDVAEEIVVILVGAI